MLSPEAHATIDLSSGWGDERLGSTLELSLSEGPMRRFATHRVEDPLSELRSEIRILTDQIRESADSEAAKELVHKVDFLLDTLARETQKRRQNWNSLEDREDLLRGLVSTADTFFLIGPDGRFLDVGEGTSASLGYSRF